MEESWTGSGRRWTHPLSTLRGGLRDIFHGYHCGPWRQSIDNSHHKGKGISLFISTVVLGFSVLGFRALPGFRALCTGNQTWIYVINLPGFSALPGFKAPFYGDGQSALNPGTTVYTTMSYIQCFRFLSQEEIKFGLAIPAGLKFGGASMNK